MPSNFDPQRSDDRRWENPDSPAENTQDQDAGQALNRQLEAAIWKTLERAAHGEPADLADRSAREVVIEVARRHPEFKTVDDLVVASDLVASLGKFALPARIFHPSIERLSPEIAAHLLSDPIASGHLNRAWKSARHAAGLTEE